MRSVFVRRAGHTISHTDRAAKLAALSTNPYQQDGGKRAHLAPSYPGHHSQTEGDPGHHYQQEGYPDAHFSPQEVASSDDIPSQPGGASQPDAHFSQQEVSSNDYIPYQQEVSSPNPIIILSDQ